MSKKVIKVNQGKQNIIAALLEEYNAQPDNI
jgi:hypothetical protein